MKKLLNTLFITQPDVYISADGDNIVIKRDDKALMRVPLLNLESVKCFNFIGVSPNLMQKCADNNIDLSFFTPNGRFQARVVGKVKGNVLLRKEQIRVSESPEESVKYARNFVIGKLYNARKVIERATRDHPYTVDISALTNVSSGLQALIKQTVAEAEGSSVMAYEGAAAKQYYSVFDELIIQQKRDFRFNGRNRRPPLDRVNALLGFLYTLLANDCVSALEGVGLDPYIGFLHQDRPGRPSLGLDLMEELRPSLADRLALALINRQQLNKKNFLEKENGAVLLDDEGRKIVLTAWQERKKEIITHPYLGEKIEVGLLPHAHAMLLARAIRGDISGYPPFFWK